MRTLGELNIVSTTIAEEMAQATRFRNVLSHTYGNIIDHDAVYRALQDLERYRTFVSDIRDHLESIGAFDDTSSE